MTRIKIYGLSRSAVPRGSLDVWGFLYTEPAGGLQQRNNLLIRQHATLRVYKNSKLTNSPTHLKSLALPSWSVLSCSPSCSDCVT